jgi:hypothetical protein
VGPDFGFPKIQRILSDNAAPFKATADWIRKSERLHNFLADQEIKWQFNLSKSPWWGKQWEKHHSHLNSWRM